MCFSSTEYVSEPFTSKTTNECFLNCSTHQLCTHYSWDNINNVCYLKGGYVNQSMSITIQGMCCGIVKQLTTSKITTTTTVTSTTTTTTTRQTTTTSKTTTTTKTITTKTTTTTTTMTITTTTTTTTRPPRPHDYHDHINNNKNQDNKIDIDILIMQKLILCLLSKTVWISVVI